VADTVIITGEKTITVVTVGVQGPAGISGASVPATNATLGGIIVGDNLSITGNGVLSAQPGGVTTFNNRTGNVSLTANDVTTLVDANYIQVWRDTQTTAGTLSQFPKYSAITSSSGPIQGYSRGLLTSNTSGTITKTIFDGNLYASSVSTVLQYKAIGFNANDTGSANSSKSGRLLVGQYGEVYLESSTKVNANTLTTATFDVLATQRPSGTTQSLDPHAINGGIHARYAIGATGAYNPSNADRVGGGKVAEFDLFNITRLITFSNGTSIGRPAQVYLTATNDLTAADPDLAFDHAYDYKTTLSLGESAELIFRNANRTSLRTPNMTAYSILTQGYADSRYALLDNNISQSITGNGAFTISSTAGSYSSSTVWDYTQGVSSSYGDDIYISSFSLATNQASWNVQDLDSGQNINVVLTSTSAELFYNGNYTQTNNSLLARSMMDARYQAIGAYLTSANLTFANLTGTPTTLAGYGITDGLTSENLALYLTISSANATYAFLGHTHSIANVTGLQTALDAKLETSNFTYANLTGKPSTFAPSAHNHAISEVTGLQTTLDGKLPSANFTYANITGTPNLTVYLTTANATATYQPLGNYATTSCLTFANLTGKPTTLSGYGITDGYSTSNPSGYITAGANTFTGAQNLQDNELFRAKLRDYSESVSSPTISSGTLTLNLETSNIFTVSLNAAITTITITNVPASGSGASFTLIFTADGTPRSVTWPTSIKWAGGTAPTITSTSGKADSFAFFSSDGGTSWQGYVGGQNF
jgi:hypothetical protein